MELQFKHPPVQSEAVTAVCAVFNGQPMRTTTYHLGVGDVTNIQQCMDMTDTGFRNHPPVSSARAGLGPYPGNLHAVQRRGGLKAPNTLAGLGINLPKRTPLYTIIFSKL